MNVPFGFTVSMASHFYSPLSSSLIVPAVGGVGEIFKTDFTGDGFTQDPLPGTKLGDFDRNINASQINGFLNKYNGTVADQPTPAGQALVAAGLIDRCLPTAGLGRSCTDVCSGSFYPVRRRRSTSELSATGAFGPSGLPVAKGDGPETGLEAHVPGEVVSGAEHWLLQCRQLL